MTDKHRRHGRWQLILVFTVFFLPFAAAWLMYLGVIDWRPQESTASGTLIDPVLSLPDHKPTYYSRIYDTDFLKRRWTLVYISGSYCQADCEDALLLMRQVRASLGKYSDRIGRVYMAPDNESVLAEVLGAFPDMEVVTVDSLSERILNETSAQPGDYIYLVDPLSNVMMRFDKDHDPRAMHNDLKRLLKYSRIG